MLTPKRKTDDQMLRPSFMPGFGLGKKQAAAGPKGLKIEHRIGVQAPPQAIWEHIADISGWPDWNPIYRRASGVLTIGGPLELVVALPDLPERRTAPVILEWVPNEQLLWRSSVAAGLGHAIRYIEIDQVAENASIFSNGELYLGWLGPASAKRIQRPLKRGFAAMGEALKARVEATWRGRG